MGTNPLIEALADIHTQPKRLQSNYVRDHSQIVARLASCGLITTAIPGLDGMYGYFWRVTLKGLQVLDKIGDDDAETPADAPG